MLSSVVRIIALPACFFVTFIDVFVKFPHYFGVGAALPPGAEDEIVLIEHLPGRRVHLQDFFWTGAEDAPPWLDPDQTLNLYETRTIHRTATIYGPEDDKRTMGGGEPAKDPRLGDPHDPGCVSCIEPTPTILEADQDIGVLIGEDPGPRYWLLTVLRSGENIPTKVELRLARLYRTAFARQQQRHLGLLATDPRLRRAATKTNRATLENRRSTSNRSSFNNNRALPKSDDDAQSGMSNLTSESSKREKEMTDTTETTKMREIKLSRSVDSSKDDRDSKHDEESTSKNNANRSKVETNSSVTKNWRSMHVFSSLTGGGGRFYRTTNFSNESNDSTLGSSRSVKKTGKFIDESTNDRAELTNSNGTKLRSLPTSTVQVRMQNTSVTDSGSAKLIYTVHLGGKPVPAETAAKDMALLSPQEVALELGVPVVVQSEPYLKETRPLALSRKRDAWLLIGAAGAAIILFTLVIAALVIAAKRKRAHSAVSAPPVESIPKKDRGYTPTTPGFDNTGYTSETEGRTQTDGTSQRQTPGSHSRSPLTPLTPESLEDDIRELSSDNDEDFERQRSGKTWQILEYPGKSGGRKVRRKNAIDRPKTPDSMEAPENRDENIVGSPEDSSRFDKLTDAASPHSYLSMPSCKLFPSMRSVEPLSKILEPMTIKHLDIEFETPEMTRRQNGRYDNREIEESASFARTISAHRDPGFVGPIVWDLRRQRAVEESVAAERETGGEGAIVSGPVGRARRRLHELLEDSFGLFVTREGRGRETACFSSRPSSAARSPDRQNAIGFPESRGKSARASPVATPIFQPKARPRTSLARVEDRPREIPETINAPRNPRGAWGSRPLSAGPFHRPNLPEIDVNRVLTNHQLSPEDPAVPLIAAIRKELEKFTPEMRSQ